MASLASNPVQLVMDSSSEPKESPVRGFMKQFVADGVSIKSEIFQGEKLEGKDGSCDGVATEWLRCNVQGKPEQFRDLVVKDFDQFGKVNRRLDATKAEMMGRSMHLNQEFEVLSSRINAAQFARMELLVKGAGVTDPPEGFPKLAHLAVKALPTIQLEEAERRVDKVIDELVPAAKANIKATLGVSPELRAVYSEMVFGKDSTFGLQDAGQGKGNTLLEDLKHKLLHDPGYYLLYISKPGRTSGHTIGVHVSDRPRFMDANSCEIEFDRKELLNLFLDHYWDGLYKDHKGPYHLYRFPEVQKNFLDSAADTVRSIASSAMSKLGSIWPFS